MFILQIKGHLQSTGLCCKWILIIYYKWGLVSPYPLNNIQVISLHHSPFNRKVFSSKPAHESLNQKRPVKNIVAQIKTDFLLVKYGKLLHCKQNICNIIDLFSETHRTVLNQILRQSTTPLSDGPFSVLVDHTRILDFDVKRRYFRHELERLDEGMRREDLAVHVRREHVFEDSFRELFRRSPEEWKHRFYIVFEGRISFSIHIEPCWRKAALLSLYK